MTIRNGSADTDKKRILSSLPRIIYNCADLLIYTALTAGIFYTFQ